MKLIITFIIVFIINLSNEWITYYEDKSILISYSSQICEDKFNGFAFEYYLIRVQNKTNETLVINFQKSNDKINELENKVALVLNPNQIIEGTCRYNSNQLRIFKSENTGKDSDFLYEFELSKIDVIEVY
jgi:hypothetical protein